MVGSIFVAADGIQGLQAFEQRGGVAVGFELRRIVRPLPGQVEVVDHDPVVEARTADEQRPPPRSTDPGECGCVGVSEVGDRELVGRFDEIEQVMADLGALGRRRLRRADVHAAIHLHAVDRDEVDVAELSGCRHGNG